MLRREQSAIRKDQQQLKGYELAPYGLDTLDSVVNQFLKQHPEYQDCLSKYDLVLSLDTTKFAGGEQSREYLLLAGENREPTIVSVIWVLDRRKSSTSSLFPRVYVKTGIDINNLIYSFRSLNSAIFNPLYYNQFPIGNKKLNSILDPLSNCLPPGNALDRRGLQDLVKSLPFSNSNYRSDSATIYKKIEITE